MLASSARLRNAWPSKAASISYEIPFFFPLERAEKQQSLIKADRDDEVL